MEASQTDQLKGDALEKRAAELDIEGRSQMSADELRDAVAQAEASGDSDDNGAEPDNADATADVVSGGDRPLPEEVHDNHDVGVDMLAGSDEERVGPEDAAGVGPKRGDYEDRFGDLTSLNSHEVVEIPGGGEMVVNGDGGIDFSPRSVAVPQAPRFLDQGEVEGKKGGVETTADDSDEEYAQELPSA